MAEPFLVPALPGLDDGEYDEADWAGLDAAVAGHVTTSFGQRLDPGRVAHLRALVAEGEQHLPALASGPGRVQMQRLLRIARLVIDQHDR